MIPSREVKAGVIGVPERLDHAIHTEFGSFTVESFGYAVGIKDKAIVALERDAHENPRSALAEGRKGAAAKEQEPRRRKAS